MTTGSFYYYYNYKTLLWWEQRWCSYESTRLPPTWLGLKSRRRRHIWHEFVVGSLPCLKRFSSSGTVVFPSPQKSTLSKSNLIHNEWTHFNEFLRTPKYLVGKQIKLRFELQLHMWQPRSFIITFVRRYHLRRTT